MPTVLRMRGYRFFLFSNERQEPPHIHAASAGRYAEVRLDFVEIAESCGYNAVQPRKLIDLVAEHRDVLREAWHGFINPQ